MDFALNGNVFFHNKEWTTSELRELSSKLSTFLQLNHVTENSVLALAMERTPMLLVSVITLLNENILFLPISEELPTERLEYMLNNAQVDAILTDTRWVSDRNMKYPILFFDKNEVNVRKIEKKHLAKQDLAYILFTSGSTGKPKGVEVYRNGLINFLYAISERIEFPNNVRIACFTSEMFDIFFLESVFAMHNGMTIILADREERNNPKKMVDLIRENNVNVIQMTPTSLEMLQVIDKNFECLHTVCTIMVGGEKFPAALLKKLQCQTLAKIYNMYGPTETTIWSIIADLTTRNEITIGTPVLNTEVYILDQEQKRLDYYEEGEICIAGKGLAKGYRNNNKQTENSFINIFLDGEYKRVYKTGDLGYQKENGEFVCLGRSDLQIKVRGHRIELEEIEENLVTMDVIDKAVTSIYEDEYGKKIICFYTSKQELEENVLRQFLAKRLPQYMIPSRFIKVNSFEYTASKKIDRKKMIQNFMNKIQCDNTYSELLPQVKCNQIIHRILNEILGTNNLKIELNSTFDELGMDSLMYINFIVRIEEEFQIEIDDQLLTQEATLTLDDIIAHVNKTEM